MSSCLLRLAVALLLPLLLAACAPPTPPADGARVEQPASLSYPDAAGAAYFPNYRAVAERAAGIYVRVRVLSEERADLGGHDSPVASNVLSYASGIIVDPRGYVVTAAHIALSDKFKAEVITLDGRRYNGRVVAVERQRELGLIKIAPFPGMAVAQFRDSATLAKGEPALAIGTPGHHGGIVSLGRILDPRRAQRISYSDFGYDNAVTLSMEVEPGHSGGPVLDREGRLVGMIASYGLGKVGSQPYVSPHLAFAVPASDILAFLRAHAGG
jgi:serine protease Do